MKISELPEEIKLKAFEYQRNETDPTYDKETDYLGVAFDWENTKEDYHYWLDWHNKEYVETPTDQNVLNVIESFKKRSEVGLKKYGCTTERTDLSLFDWLNHLQEELKDAILYIEASKNKLK